MTRKKTIIALFAALSIASTIYGATSSATIGIAPSISTYLNAQDASPFNQSLQKCLQERMEQVKLFTLPQQPENPVLLALIICSDLIDADEKQYWFDILPQMTEKQKAKLLETLIAEYPQGTDTINSVPPPK